MNQMIQTLLQHRSIRKFKNQPLTDEQVQWIVKSAQAASTSSYIQAYTIIGVTDVKKKEQLAELVGNQPYVAQNGHFFVFCGDLFRHEMIGGRVESLESTEKFMVSLIDTALAAQNAAIAAESMGLGICFIGGIRNNLHAVQEILHVPKRVLPLFGLAIGVPDQDGSPKPRLPFEHIYHENVYQADSYKMKKQLDEYDEIVELYYDERTQGKRKEKWTEQVVQKLEKPQRMYMKEFVEDKGFILK